MLQILPSVLTSDMIHGMLLFGKISLFFGLFITPIAGFSVYIERRLSAKMQSRIGCHRLGPEGILQLVADGIKMLCKEDLYPRGSDVVLFKFAPYLVMIGAFTSFACIPFGDHVVMANIDVGIVYLLGLSSLVVVGIMLAGWSSNNKWSLLGSLRSAAQIISYEIPLGLTLLVPVIITGSMNLQAINHFQSGGVSKWLVFYAGPFTIIAFVIYFISALAEVNRTPFDLPEAESELVSGFHTEYSGMRWGLFFVGEYANMFLVSCIAVTLFLGGYQRSMVNIAFVGLTCFFIIFLLLQIFLFLPTYVSELWKGQSLLDVLMKTPPQKRSNAFKVMCLGGAFVLASLMYRYHLDYHWIQVFVFVSKAYFLVLVMMWLRWSLPRYRMDQLMDLCWKKCIPISFVCICGTLIWMVVQ